MTAHDRATGILSIDLDAIADNWRTLAAHAPNAEAAGVVKADGYGLGAAPVARALRKAGCTTFFVATIDEGISLRPHVNDARILVLGGVLPGTGADFIGHQLIPVLNSPEQIGLWSGFAAAGGRPLPAAIHIDSGMNRLGLDETAVELLAADNRRLDGIQPVLVMSHMACADERDHAMNRQQLDRFTVLADRLGVSAPRSLAASSTIFLGADYHFDLIRPGAGLYGINPMPDSPNPLRQTVRLHGKILQVRDVDTPRPLAMVPAIGSNPRAGSPPSPAVTPMACSGPWAIAALVSSGVKVPVVGRISMDLITLDVSAVAPAHVHAGALVELIGPDHDVDALAAEAGTIGYEILTSLGRRYLRDYSGGNT